ncbi:methionine--tRNA ligase [Candidatus Dojkabacteria bacterium]|uniref:Methionine--tRNA ligase n=1 Tax=Candidatus Dojkabacteria bacterium TaxID=2099670 RepID=A0A955KWP6_9BACT|nr:methionine--tRNA ligase [Candidatus Dojkabacteria bacterium]MCB9790864.1 methionine--tRNA ligase [Candidatus Nomurabacteria bacterium]
MIRLFFNKEITPQKIFIGVSWPYANGDIHIGHLAGQNVVADVFARYHRLKGNNVLMVSGSDSHGAPVVFKAEELGITPEEMAKKSHESIVASYKALGLLYENYTSTTTELHAEVSQNIFLTLKEYGYLDIKKSKQYFDETVKRFLPDRYVRGTCPKCGATNARGDECPECGAFLEPEDLIDPYSTLSESVPIMKETEHFYMDLSALQKDLGEWISKKSKPWRKWVREFSLGWIKQGLEPRPVTRDMDFGVPVPVKGWENKVLYVWIEAVVGYLSAAIEWAQKNGNPSSWEDFWKDSECKHYYFIAGGNVPFHTIIWPGEIIAYNQKYQKVPLERPLPGESLRKPLNLPYDIPANNMLMYKGKKMSKGDGNSLTVSHLLEEYGPDPLRYFFVKYAPEKQDREFTMKDFIEANNNELVGNIGNFINRALTFSRSHFGKKVPNGILDEEVEKEIYSAFEKTSKYLEKAQFIKAIETILKLGHFANKYFNDSEPWVKIKSSPHEAEQIIYNAIQLVSALQSLLKPFTPFAAAELARILNCLEPDPNAELDEKGRVETIKDSWFFNEVRPGSKISEPKLLFKKFEYTKELEEQDSTGIV